MISYMWNLKYGPNEPTYETETDSLFPMTEENCHTENWDADPDIYKPSSFFDKITVAVNAFVRWFKLFIEFVLNNVKNG